VAERLALFAVRVFGAERGGVARSLPLALLGCGPRLGLRLTVAVRRVLLALAALMTQGKAPSLQLQALRLWTMDFGPEDTRFVAASPAFAFAGALSNDSKGAEEKTGVQRGEEAAAEGEEALVAGPSLLPRVASADDNPFVHAPDLVADAAPQSPQKQQAARRVLRVRRAPAPPAPPAPLAPLAPPLSGEASYGAADAKAVAAYWDRQLIRLPAAAPKAPRVLCALDCTNFVELRASAGDTRLLTNGSTASLWESGTAPHFIEAKFPAAALVSEVCLFLDPADVNSNPALLSLSFTAPNEPPQSFSVAFSKPVYGWLVLRHPSRPHFVAQTLTVNFLRQRAGSNPRVRQLRVHGPLLELDAASAPALAEGAGSAVLSARELLAAQAKLTYKHLFAACAAAAAAATAAASTP
jgi:hypothetical protein